MLLKDLQTLATKLATGTLFHVEKAGKAYSVDYSALAKAIIEEYADSTVGGSKQSVQAAIAALNSRPTVNAIQKNEVSLNTLTVPGHYACNRCTDTPDNYTGWVTLTVLPNGGGGDGNPKYVMQVAFPLSSSNLYVRYCDNGTFSAWEKLPTRAEISALDARVTALENS